MIAFGPIPSRRLGMSLGVNNIVSPKKCTYSCVYCQVGKTRQKTTHRDVFITPEKLVKDVRQHLQKLDPEHRPDYLTIVSNGEPTLDIHLGEEIQQLKQSEIPVAVITNASLIDKKEVREDLMLADWVSLKIDSVDESAWKRINQPAADLVLNRILEGMQQFSRHYKGFLCTETMLVEGYNDQTLHLENTASFISRLRPYTAYLSIPTRPPAEKKVKAVTEAKITEAWKIYQDKKIHTQLLTGFEGTDTGYTGNIYEDILNITSVHPLREDTLQELLKKGNTNKQVVDTLLKQGLIKEISYNDKKYYLRHFHY